MLHIFTVHVGVDTHLGRPRTLESIDHNPCKVSCQSELHWSPDAGYMQTPIHLGKRHSRWIVPILIGFCFFATHQGWGKC